MNDRQIRDEAITMFAAGHETSATGLSWLLFELAKHPEIVTKILKETEIFEDVPTFEQLLHFATTLYTPGCRRRITTLSTGLDYDPPGDAG